MNTPNGNELFQFSSFPPGLILQRKLQELQENNLAGTRNKNNNTRQTTPEFRSAQANQDTRIPWSKRCAGLWSLLPSGDLDQLRSQIPSPDYQLRRSYAYAQLLTTTLKDRIVDKNLGGHEEQQIFTLWAHFSNMICNMLEKLGMTREDLAEHLDYFEDDIFWQTEYDFLQEEVAEMTEKCDQKIAEKYYQEMADKAKRPTREERPAQSPIAHPLPLANERSMEDKLSTQPVDTQLPDKRQPGLGSVDRRSRGSRREKGWKQASRVGKTSTASKPRRQAGRSERERMSSTSQDLPASGTAPPPLSSISMDTAKVSVAAAESFASSRASTKSSRSASGLELDNIIGKQSLRTRSKRPANSVGRTTTGSTKLASTATRVHEGRVDKKKNRRKNQPSAKRAGLGP